MYFCVDCKMQAGESVITIVAPHCCSTCLGCTQMQPLMIKRDCDYRGHVDRIYAVLLNPLSERGVCREFFCIDGKTYVAAPVDVCRRVVARSTGFLAYCARRYRRAIGERIRCVRCRSNYTVV